MEIAKRVVVTALLGALMVSLVLGFACAEPEATPTPTPTATPTPTPTPKVEVVIYTDFQCPHCAELFFTVEEELVRLYGNTSEVRIESKPINGLGNASLITAEAALCAGDQGQYWEYSNALFTAGPSAYSEEELIRTAVALGLNEEAFASCLATGAKEAEVDANLSEFFAAGGSKIPAVFINGNMTVGVKPLQTYVDLIDQLLSQ